LDHTTLKCSFLALIPTGKACTLKDPVDLFVVTM
jgi:hypothetical protein